MYILFPGRHHLLTCFQFDYLKKMILSKCEGMTDVDGKPIGNREVSGVVFAVTSANHSNTRRNPLPFYLRAMALEEFSRALGVPCFIYGIDDVGHLENFAAYTLKKIKHESDGRFALDPASSLVLCSTPVLEMYERLGFTILPAELEDKATYKMKTDNPWDLVEKIARNASWASDPSLAGRIHPASLHIWTEYRLGEKVSRLFSDRMIGDDGDITATRDYNSYVRQMDDIAKLKYEDTAPYIQSGRVGDIGCAAGSWIKLACHDPKFRESDFYGIEVARQLYDICLQRKHNGEFHSPYVFFSQKNAVTGLAFDPSSMNTIHTSSLTHEIVSYGSLDELVRFIANRHKELVPHGVWINRDVVGPENKDDTVLMKLNKTDGRQEDYAREIGDRGLLADYLRGLSTYGRFLRFARDFRKVEHGRLSYEIRNVQGEDYISLRLQDACEFISKKDYVDNWQSEMHEVFCFWSYSDWIHALEKAGFRVKNGSRAYVNSWLVQNRYQGKVELFKDGPAGPETIPFPETNVLLIAEKEL